MREAKAGLPRTIDWVDGAIAIIDQTALPAEMRVVRIETTDALIEAISRLAVRGAPALGAAGALGVALAATTAEGDEADVYAQVQEAAERLRRARPTAVNLAWGIERALGSLKAGPGAVLAEALKILEEDAIANRRIGERGARLLSELGLDQVSALTHCNTGALACVEWGTALGVLRQLQAENRLRRVIATETRPLLQGARLTAFELSQMGVDHEVIVDSAAAFVLSSHMADVAIVGADRIAANGDVANKIGTLGIALAAAHAGVPFIVAAPESTIDPATPDGAGITVEQRDGTEVTSIGGTRTAPLTTPGLNPAFDVTPTELVTAVVTDERVLPGGRSQA
ncbi:MAG: S-methyl-5-thioribose-1-phosphate isomerase [Acidimicrobiales bacterium]